MISIKSQKTGSQPVGARKKCFSAICKWEKMVPRYFSLTNTVAAIQRQKKCGSLIFGDQKNVVLNCQEQGNRL